MPPPWTRRHVSNSEATSLDTRVLFLAPTATDGASTQALLSKAGIRLEICSTFDGLVSELTRGSAAMIVPEEAISFAHTTTLHEVLANQPAWSDLPVLVLTRPGADSAELSEAVRTLGNVTLLERPLRIATLLSAVRTAVRARERQYQIRGHLEERARHEESLRVADQRKDEFLATLGHELRNPLAPLVTGLQLLKTTGLHDSAATQVAGIMERQISHLIRLVDDLLELSRITRGVIDVQREPLDLALRRAFGDRHDPSSVCSRGTRADRRHAGRRGHHRFRGCRPPDASVRQPPHERRKVYRRGWSYLAHRAHGGRRRRGLHTRQRYRNRTSAPPIGVRHVYAGRSLESPHARRAGDRSDAGAEHCRDARWPRRGPKRRPGFRKRVRGAVANARETTGRDGEHGAVAAISSAAHSGGG